MPQGTGNASGPSSNDTQRKQQVVDFNEVRAQRLEEKRRKTERIFFKNLLSVYSVTGDATMSPVELIDVSETGCAFQVPYDAKNPWPTESSQIPLRLYFSQDTYLEIFVSITNSSPSIENNMRYVRYGCAIDSGTASYQAYQQFVRFMKLYAEQAHKDNGDVTIFYL
jgi:hypothetical protein